MSQYKNQEVGQNTFGQTLTALISPIFNPTSRDERKFVAEKGYIPSKRRERYVDPIDKIIRAARPPSELNASEFEDTSKPNAVISRLRNPKELEHKVLLLIGSVGSGKSTFIDHLYEVALPRDVIRTTVWARINMNSAPVSANEIYKWLKIEITEACRNNYPNEDFDDLDIIRKVFAVEINKFNKGVGRLYENDATTYNLKLAEYIETLQKDDQIVAIAHVRYTCGDRNKLFVIVLDNCDKKTRDEQLLMFEAAQWLQKEFRCLVILPLRDETYDNHRDQPPLDTALKDLVFRIEPPLFQQVLISRVQLALKELSSTGKEKLRFSLPNGITVEYTRSDQAFFLASIVKSLLEYDRFVRRMIVGLSGRNMRRALEIFLEFCNSGHIGEDQIFKIRQSEGNYSLPIEQVARVLLRMNRRYYDSDSSYIKNLFASNKDDPVPSFFSRYMILKWLRLHFNSSGTSGLKGYFPKRIIKAALVPYGLLPDILDREFNYLLTAQCIIAEHLRMDSVDDDDLIRLGPAGFVHLDLVGNVNYLATVAEDTNFPDRSVAEQVMQRIRDPNKHHVISSTLHNAEDLLIHLNNMKKSLFPPNGSFMGDNLIEILTDLTDATDAIIRVNKSQAGDPWFDADLRLTRGSLHKVTVKNVVEYGSFVEFEDGINGLVHKKNYNGFLPNIGDRLQIKIIWVDAIQKKMNIEVIASLEEEAGDLIEGAHEKQSTLPL